MVSLQSKATFLNRFYQLFGFLHAKQDAGDPSQSIAAESKVTADINPLKRIYLALWRNDIKRTTQHEAIMSFFLISIIFFIPLSPSLKSILIGITTAFICFMPTYQQRFFSVLSQPVSIAALILAGIALVGCCWSVASFPQSLISAEKYFKILFIPLFAIGFTHQKTRTIGIHAFLLSALIVSILSISKHWHLLNFNTNDPGHVFHNHIVTGYMTAFAAYLSALYATRTQRMERAGYALLAALLTYQVLFVNTGRTGYIVYFILLGLLILMSFSSKRQVITLILVSTILGGVVISAPSALSTGIHRALDDWRNYKGRDKNTSIGYRLQFHQYAKSLFLSKPIIGYGTGGFKAQFKNDNPIPQRGDILYDPHSQYWFVASEFGLLGIAGLCYLFATLLIMSLRLAETKAVLFGLLISFFFANITDSFLTNTGMGYLFVMFCALCLGECIKNQPSSTVSAIS